MSNNGVKEFKQMKEKRQTTLHIILVLFCILFLITGFCLFVSVRAYRKSEICCQMKVSDRQREYADPMDKRPQENAYTELMGFGRLELDESEPFIYLINPPDNSVYLRFGVFCDGEELYQSDLIEPGRMEDFDICSRLDAGEHTLTYSISSYDLKSRAVLWSGVQQNQDILIRK